MDYKNRIFLNEEASNRIKEGINQLSEAVLLTMGPHGKTVIISDNMGNPYVTKDGVSVAREVTFEDPIKNIAANLIKEVANNTVKEVGDGTTTSICLANSIINKGTQLMSEGATYNEIKTILEDLEAFVIKELKKKSSKLKKEDINIVAAISANNDSEIGKIIKEAYLQSDLVKLEVGNNEKDVLEVINGMKLNSGYLDPAFINKRSDMSISYDKAKLVINDGSFEDLNLLNSLIKNWDMTTPIIILADSVSDQALRILKNQHNQGNINIGLVKSPGYAEHRRNLVSDIIKGLECKEHKIAGKRNALYYTDINNIKIKKDSTIISFMSTKTSETLVKSYKEAIRDYTEEYDIDLMQQRIDNLEGVIASIKVGGTSEIELKERYDRMEDAILSTKCALEDGIIEGGGVELARIGNIIRENPFADCLASPYNRIIKNGAKYEYSDDMYANKVVDPLKVTISALRNAISVSKTLLSTEAVILKSRTWN